MGNLVKFSWYNSRTFGPFSFCYALTTVANAHSRARFVERIFKRNRLVVYTQECVCETTFLETQRKKARFDDLLVQLYAAEDANALVRAAGELLRLSIDADFYGVAVCEAKTRRTTCAWFPNDLPILKYVPAFEPVAHQHPLLAGWKREGDTQRPMRISDCVEDSEFRNGAVYSEIFKPMRSRSQLGVWAELTNKDHIEISANRCSGDFSDLDVARLAKIRPHIAQAYKIVCQLAELRALPAPSVQLCMGSMRVIRMDASAYMRTAERFHPNARIEGLDQRIARLTPRELEVLHWIREGKTNPQIAIILKLSQRTVHKHVESIFQKLNVETRTAAAIRATEIGIVA